VPLIGGKPARAEDAAVVVVYTGSVVPASTVCVIYLYIHLYISILTLVQEWIYISISI
jgi:hypothetical protein